MSSSAHACSRARDAPSQMDLGTRLATRQFMTALTLEQCMSQPLQVVTLDQTCREIRELASRKRIHHFPIVEGQELVAFVCTCDLRRAPLDAPIAHFASRHPVTVSPRCSALDAAWLMLLNSVGSLVVVDQRDLRGIVTCEDLRAMDAECARVLEAARCAECGAGTHLRPGPGGRLRCVKCKDRLARGDLSRPPRASATSLPHS